MCCNKSGVQFKASSSSRRITHSFDAPNMNLSKANNCLLACFKSFLIQYRNRKYQITNRPQVRALVWLLSTPMRSCCTNTSTHTPFVQLFSKYENNSCQKKNNCFPITEVIHDIGRVEWSLKWLDGKLDSPETHIWKTAVSVCSECFQKSSASDY